MIASAAGQNLAVGREGDRRDRSEVRLQAEGLQVAIGRIPAAK